MNQKLKKAAATVELALLLPVLLLLTFGIAGYGLLFLRAHQITNVARHGARLAIRPDATSAEVMTSVDSCLQAYGLGTYNLSISPPDISSLTVGEQLNVRIVVLTADIPAACLLNMPFLPCPDELAASVTMAKEGPY